MMMREDFPDIQFFPFKENLGFPRLVNNGLKKPEGNYILILNADIIIEKKSADILLEQLKNNPHIGIVGPKLLNFDGKVQPSCFQILYSVHNYIPPHFSGKISVCQKKNQQISV